MLGINSWGGDKSVSEGIGFAIALDSLLDLAPPHARGRGHNEPRLARGGSATMSTVRLRRLQADYDEVRDYVNRHPRLQLIQSDGTPPERYQLEYRIRGLRQTADELATVKSHMVEIALPVCLSADAAAVPDAHSDLSSQHRAPRDLHRRPLEPGRAALVDHRADRRDDLVSKLQHQEPLERRGGTLGRPASRRAAT